MPYDRRTGRVLLAMMGMVGVAVSVGCMRSSNLRPGAGSLPELKPAGELHPVAGTAAPAATPATPTDVASSADRDAIAPPPRPTPDAAAGASASPVPGGAAAVATSEAPAAGLAPGTAEPVDASPTGGPTPAAPAPPGGSPSTPASLPTPLLDAEIRRAEAVNQQHIESLHAADRPAPAIVPDSPPPVAIPAPPSADVPVPAGPKPADPGPDVLAPLPLAASTRPAVEPEALVSPRGIAVSPLIPIDRNADGADPPSTTTPSREGASETPLLLMERAAEIADVREPGRRVDEPAPIRPEPVAADARTEDRPAVAVAPATDSPPAPEDRRSLQIAALQLCSRVKEFGGIEPVNPEALKPGQRVRVYCEMTGLEYRAIGDVFVSRLAAHIELRSGTDGPVVWEQAPETAKDLCHRPRQDYYVSYLIEIPRTLEPGPYRLRLIQTDLVGNRAASREIPITIVR